MEQGIIGKGKSLVNDGSNYTTISLRKKKNLILGGVHIFLNTLLIHYKYPIIEMNIQYVKNAIILLEYILIFIYT